VIEIVWQARLRSFGNFHKNLSEQKKKLAELYSTGFFVKCEILNVN
jgi:hypothetical protein